MYDANLVFSESYSVAGVSGLAQVGSTALNIGEYRGLEGAENVFLEIEVLEAPTASEAFPAFNFALVGSTDEAGTNPVILASSPLFGSLLHLGGGVAPVTAGSKYLIPVNSGFTKESDVTRGTYRPYVSVWFTNVADAYSGGSLGGLSAGKFRISLRMGNPTGGRIYPKGY